MDTDVISRLLNYLITHVITGIIALILIITFVLSVWGVNIYSWAVTLDIWIFLLSGFIVVFTLGDLIDAAALLFLDYFLLKNKYSQRPSEIDITSDKIIRLVVACNLLRAGEINKDNAKQVLRDIIPSLFSSAAPPYIQSKREDIDSLYQYHSNMLLLLIISFPLIPIILYKYIGVVSVILIIMIVHLVLICVFYQFAINGLTRTFSIEDRFFFGYLLEHAKVKYHQEHNEKISNSKKSSRSKKNMRRNAK